MADLKELQFSCLEARNSGPEKMRATENP